MKLHTWQRQCIRVWQANHFYGMANVATGAGKTVMALYGIRFFGKTHGK